MLSRSTDNLLFKMSVWLGLNDGKLTLYLSWACDISSTHTPSCRSVKNDAWHSDPIAPSFCHNPDGFFPKGFFLPEN